MLMAEIRLGGTHKELHGKHVHLFNIGDLTNDQRAEVLRQYKELYPAGDLVISPTMIPDRPIPDVSQPPNVDGLPNAAFLQYQYELEKEVITLADEVRQDSILKESGHR